MNYRLIMVIAATLFLGGRESKAQATCLAANTLSGHVRERIVAMVTSAGPRADSGRADINLPATTPDSVVLVTSDSLCSVAAAARATAHSAVSNPPAYSLWLFKVASNRYVAFDVEYKSGEYQVLDVLDASLAILASITM